MTLYDPAAPPPVPGRRRGASPVFDPWPQESWATLLTYHVVVPAAVIAMVAALLFYLVDVRSAFFGGGPSLKWIGLCFAVATVLTERYRQSSADTELQGCYTVFLASAIVVVLLVEPWEARSTGWSGKLANLLIVAVVWGFATGITRGLSPETTASSKPAVVVARLAALALLAFAVGEPILLGAVPQAGERALAAVIVFLLATGVALAAGSSMGTVRRVEKAGGRVPTTLVPGRVALAALLMVVVLAAGLAVPGIQVRGTGRLRPPPAPGAGAEADRGHPEGEEVHQEGNQPQRTGDGARREVGSMAGDQGRDGGSRGRSSEGLTGPAAPLLSPLASLGKWLLLPLVLALAFAGLYALSRLLPRLGDWGRKMAERWRAVLAKLAGRFRSESPSRVTLGRDPLADLDRLAHLPARDAVLAAYHTLLDACERLGHPRPERSTPYEFLYSLPPPLKTLEEPVRTLTHLYVNAAYGPGPVEVADRDTALGAIARVKKGLAAP